MRFPAEWCARTRFAQIPSAVAVSYRALLGSLAPWPRSRVARMLTILRLRLLFSRGDINGTDGNDRPHRSAI